ncbi:phospho-N-acetylmuramoyl-pentapeptide-transferase [Alloiococcus sp. CFN-8]|uniref:phospho-N-acetylmuramoyl-pentapeptide- transferase n=1 Tax=Alloiococcus sp. CFN-8 TaxID=3416081 RepID=UPI003CF7A409
MKNYLSILNPKILLGLILGFLIASLLAPLFIPMLHKLKFGQNIREDGPQSHLKKAGTPTMGGLIFIASSIISVFIMIRNPSDEAVIALLSMIFFGVVGFLDDILKIIRKKNLGLRAWQKMLLLLIVSLSLAYYGYTEIGTSIIIPFTSKYWNLGVLFYPFIVLYFAATTNAVNLTDGLDGLNSSVTLLVMTFFAIISFNLGHYTLAVFCVIVAGSLLGFLRFNAFPARVFMGDTGSLALGGAVGAVAMLLKLELLVIIVGGIYVTETLSVILQVASFKLTGKRIFKMAPIHHHFEQLGYSETKIVSMFSIITVVLCLIGFLAL